MGIRTADTAYSLCVAHGGSIVLLQDASEVAAAVPKQHCTRRPHFHHSSRARDHPDAPATTHLKDISGAPKGQHGQEGDGTEYQIAGHEYQDNEQAGQCQKGGR